MKMKWFIFVLVVVLMVSGCSEKDKQETAESGGDAEKAEAAEIGNKGDESKFHFPLTGIGSDEETSGRAVAVMVNNHPKARPQTGLSKADIVYEMLAEAEVTRFLAVYQSEKPEQVGPIRSARDYYIKLAKGLNSLYIAHGYSPDAKTLLSSDYIDHLNGMEYDGTLFERSNSRKAPHNSYIDFKSIEKGAEKNSYDLNKQPESFTFLTEEKADSVQGTEGESAMITYGSANFNVNYEFDKEKGKYKRFSAGEQTLEDGSNEEILIDNILIIEAPHRVIDEIGRRDINFEDGGKAYLLQKGKMNELTWENKNGRIVPMNNGTEAGLVPGKTWVNVVPDSPGLKGLVSFEAIAN